MKDDDPAVGDAEHLYWRAPEIPKENWTTFDEGRGGHRVRGGAFVWNSDGVSCYRHDVLDYHGLDCLSLKEEPKNGILSVKAGDVRFCELGVAFDPDPGYIPRDELKPRDKAHSLVVVDDEVKRRKRDSRCSRLARSAKIVHWGEASPH